MKKTVVINVVGLSKSLIGKYTPFIQSFVQKGSIAAIEPVLPAVTCSAQSTYVTGKLPGEHGIVGNGWYFKDESEVKFWRQSNQLVEGQKLWDKLKVENEAFTCANLFWWFNMYSSVDFSVTPRPNYLADGRKIPDCYSHPASLRDVLQKELGTFPLFHFWGPKTSIQSTRWIADATLITDRLYDPTLTLVYLPHLDYNVQRFGTDIERIKQDLQDVDKEVAKLVSYYEAKNAHVVLLSEYGITNVNHPIHLNRVFRQNGLLAIREERGLELLDAGASRAFAVADHQVAHIYLNDPSCLDEVRRLLNNTKGIERILEGDSLKKAGLQHRRSGDLVVVADNDSWFTYYYWLDDTLAPDFARMVDIHKKPGYDPVELYTDPNDRWVIAKIVWKLLKKKMGFRSVMDVIPLKAELVKGSHGRIPENQDDWPVISSNHPKGVEKDQVKATEVFSILEAHLKS